VGTAQDDAHNDQAVLLIYIFLYFRSEQQILFYTEQFLNKTSPKII